jgi:PAS domain S-box-containing protein
MPQGPVRPLFQSSFRFRSRFSSFQAPRLLTSALLCLCITPVAAAVAAVEARPQASAAAAATAAASSTSFGGTAPAAGMGGLMTAAAVRALSPEQAEQALPVRVRGVITFAASLIFIQDQTAGIFIDAPVSTKERYRVGQYGELEGYTAPGLFAPQIVPRKFTLLGTTPLPPARPSRVDELWTGTLDSQRVEITGIIRAVLPDERPDLRRTVTLKMASDDGVFPVYVADLPPEKLRAVVDASVRVRGVVGGVFNERRQMIGIKLYVGRAEDLIIDEPGPAEPYAVPVTPVERLLRFQPEGTNRHRVRVQGTVTLYHPGVALYLEDGTGGVSARVPHADVLAIGDRVEIIGFPAMGEWTPYLEDASYRRVGAGSDPPAPISVSADQELSAGAHDSRLVSIDAELVDQVSDAGRLLLVLKSKNVVFDAQLPRPPVAGPVGTGAGVRDLASGSRLRLTGISSVRRGADRAHPTSFQLLLRSLDDVVVLQRPSWWTLRRLAWILAALAAVAAAAVGWVLVLRRRLQTQTRTIRRQIQNEAALEARYQELFENAYDVIYTHDPSGQFLTVNRAGETLTGYSRSELLARTIFDLIPADRHEGMRAWLRKLLAGEPVPPTVEIELVVKGGRRVPVEVNVRPLTADRGATNRGDAGRVPAPGSSSSSIVAIEGIARDITARRRAEADLAAANERLVETSRRAGMAEVAAGVLHNVGNVLTSVNVSAAELAAHLRATKLPGLARAVALLEEHRGDLGRFFAEDPRALELPAYLGALHEQLAEEQGAISREVEVLGRSVEHIKEVVSMQQGYARVSGVREEVSAETMVEDALRINREGLERHAVAVVKEFSPTPLLFVEKHKVLQILVNLLSNAKYACTTGRADAGADPVAVAGAGEGAPRARARAGGRITLRIETPKGERDGDRVRIVVADNGVGIAHEHLTRIFEHGFTTRRDGHGFGLHSSALAARELGGVLLAHSDGPGRGARFTLELPARPAEPPRASPAARPIRAV